MADACAGWRRRAAHDLDAVIFHRLQDAALDRFGTAGKAKQARHGWSVNIRVENADFQAVCGKAERQINRCRGLADAALAGSHCDNCAHARNAGLGSGARLWRMPVLAGGGGPRYHIPERIDFETFTLIYLRNEEADFEVELTVNKGRTEPYNLGDGYGHLAVAVDDVDAEHARFRELGFKVGNLVDFRNNGALLARFFFVEDPDGYKIEVLQRAGRYV
ncbi:glyoxalase family protein [Brucella ceti TE28753-12]|nr:glyoxalase family protein [Brucella ceti TE28753-12]